MLSALFCDWNPKPTKFRSCSLLELPDLSDVDLIFFDPLTFARLNKFRENSRDLWEAEYITFSEKQFFKFLSQIKRATTKIQEFLDNGGIWIIRSNFPNSHIRVSKKSVTGSSRYTESVISAFFWMEHFLGKYSFQYNLENRLRYTDLDSPFYRQFHNNRVECWQTHDHIGLGEVEVIAQTRAAKPVPVISKISYAPKEGEIYLIPKFGVADEPEYLLDLFEIIKSEIKSTFKLPSWMTHYEKQLCFASPYPEQIKQIDRKKDALNRQKQAALEKQKQVELLAGLLYHQTERLIPLTEEVINQLGFSISERPSSVRQAGIQFYLKDKTAPHILLDILTSTDGPVNEMAFAEYTARLDVCILTNEFKPILIVNSCLDDDPANRQNWYDPDILTECRHRNITILTSLQLFEIACYLLQKIDSDQLESVKNSLRADILEACGQFELNERKYFASKLSVL